jgi:hypothetical protein
MLQSKLDGAFAQGHNEVQDMQAKSDEFFERSHRSVDLRKYRQPRIMSSIMRWI